MKLTICNLGLILSLFCIFSCHKNTDHYENAGKYRLTKTIGKYENNPYDTLPGVNNSLSIRDYTYDDQNRVDKITVYSADSVNGAIKPARTDYTQQYLYNGAEKNPFERVTQTLTVIGRTIEWVTTELYYFYDNSGILIKDSSGYIVKEYVYSPGKVIVNHFDTRTPGTIINYDSFTVNNHNTTGSFLYLPVKNYSLPASQYTYDNKVNPLSVLNIGVVTFFGLSNATPNVHTNNVVNQITGTFSGGFDKTGVTTYSYTYNNDGLPETQRDPNPNFYPYTTRYYYDK
jgi:hypothetical protein